MLLLEERLNKINEILKKQNQYSDSSDIIYLCEEWWEMFRSEKVLFDVYVKLVFSKS